MHQTWLRRLTITKYTTKQVIYIEYTNNKKKHLMQVFFVSKAGETGKHFRFATFEPSYGTDVNTGRPIVWFPEQ